MKIALLVFIGLAVSADSARGQARCSTAGLQLPAGFCATVFADSIRGARHLAVAPNGDVFVAVMNTRNARGGIVALRDTTGDGTADLRVRFGENGGSGIALRGTDLFFATNDAVVRYTLPSGNLLARTTPDTIVRDLPANRGHTAKTIALGRGGDLFVNIGSATNSCQPQDRSAGVPGSDPCVELQTRAGIWRFDSTKKNQTQRDGKHFATGLRNTVAITFGPDAQLYGLQMGRDQLSQNWAQFFTDEQGAENPAEIFVRVEDEDDYGWPYCFFDPAAGMHLLAPEYGGDGKAAGRCSRIREPLAAYPAHWAPESVVFYRGSQFPQHYRTGAFISFHGSWNRAPLPQGGYKVVYQPMRNGAVSGAFEVFADGFAGANVQPSGAEHRPMGLAAGPDGSLYIGDDAGGRIWRVTYSDK